MTHPTDYYCQPGPESGRALHTQESGDDGLSSNMEHRFSDSYEENVLSVAVKDSSFVRPIPEEDQGVYDGPAIPRKIWSHPSVSGHGAGPKARPAEQGGVNPFTSAVVQENYFQPQVLSESSPEGGTIMILPEAAAITEGQPDVEVAAEESCTKMDTGENPAKPKGPPVGGRKRTHRRRRAAGKNRKLYLLCWMIFMHSPVSGGFPGAQPAADQKTVNCFPCMDEDRCPKLMKIFHPNDTLLYERDLNEMFPECSAASPPGPKSCAVCRDQSNITIFCSEDVGQQIEVEDSDGEAIKQISPGCVQQQQQTSGRTRVGLALSFAFFLIVVVALVVYSCCKERGLNVVNSEEI